VLRENDMLTRELCGKFDDGHKWTPKGNTRRAWEDLDERESTRATARNRSSGNRSGDSSVRNVRYSENEEPLEVTSRGLPRKLSGNSTSGRKSSTGHSVAFEQAEEVISVPVTGAMRPSRSRVSTPFFSEEAVNRMHQKTSTPRAADSSDELNSDRHSSVNFEREVHVVEVPLGENDGHHSRSVRGRIATPFIRDVPTKETGAEENPEEVTLPQ